MVSITHTSPKYDTYQANLNYLGLLEIKEYCFLNIDAKEISIPLEKKYISNTMDFDLITPINFQESVGEFLYLNDLYDALKTTNAICFYIQTKDEISGTTPKLVNIDRYRTNYYFNLLLSEEEIIANQKRDARQRLKKVIKQVTAVMIEDNVSEAFFSNYTRISNSNRFSDKYKFTFKQFKGFSQVDGIKYIELRSHDEFVAGGFFGFNHFEVDYLYAANSEQFSDSIRLLLWHAIIYFKNLGFSQLFLGGGVTENDSLANFKIRLGTYEKKCNTIMSVLDKLKAEHYANTHFNDNWFFDYFPPYRKI